MKNSLITIVATAWIFFTPIATVAQDHMKGMDMPMKHADKMPDKSTLQPAEGASVKIISPKAGQVIKGEQVPFMALEDNTGMLDRFFGMFGRRPRGSER